MSTYRCKGKNCPFATDDLGEFIRHVVKEETSAPKQEPTRSHKTAKEHLECPTCGPMFEAELLK